jgi:hypothetical protein
MKSAEAPDRSRTSDDQRWRNAEGSPKNYLRGRFPSAWLEPTVQSVFVLNTTSGRTDGGAMVNPTASHRIENVRTAALCSLLGDAWSLEVATPMFELQDLER